ncbi:MAG: choice-of-anchor Q domain-containing protein [Planctomycetota bacterium]|jgi:predicted outer membrane repeat protein
MKKALVLNLILLLSASTLALGATRLVPSHYPTIQATIDACADGDTVVVAPGIYTGEGNRDIDFGGKGIVVRSENGPNNCIIDCESLGRAFCFHSGESSNSIVDGFTLINGHAHYGGAIYCRDSSPTITNCVLATNTAGADWSRGAGGGIFCRDSNATITNCLISGNSANKEGGGIYCCEASPRIKRCTISANRTRRADGGGWGGGIGCEGGNAHITKCTINGNSSDSGGGLCCSHYSNAIISGCAMSGNWAYRGGGIMAGSGTTVITKCTISDNRAKYDGGGIWCGDSDSNIASCVVSGNAADRGGGTYSWKARLRIINCTVSENLAAKGKALACDSYNQQDPSDIEIGNCILWDDGEEVWNNDSSTINITYSDVQGGSEGEGNTDADPCFVQVGYWDPNGTADYPWDDFWVEGDYHLLPNSPCINAGDPNFVSGVNETDIDGQPRVLGGRVDMGADEFVIEVAMTFTPKAFNPCSQGKWVKAHLVLPEEFALDDLDSNTPATLRLLGTQIESEQMNVFVNQEGAVEVEAAFDRAALCEAANNSASDLLTIGVEGLLTSGRPFYGTDAIRIISQDFRCLADFVSHWLRTDCQAPDWCAGFDVNRDSVANFLDLVMLGLHVFRPTILSE